MWSPASTKKTARPSPLCLAAQGKDEQHKGDSTISRIDASMFDGWRVVVGRAGCADSSLSKRMMVHAGHLRRVYGWGTYEALARQCREHIDR